MHSELELIRSFSEFIYIIILETSQVVTSFNNLASMT